MTIGSLFSGIGGLELGLEWLGLGPVAWQAECEPYARAVLAKHWPHARRFERVEEIDEHVPRVSVVCGGFPCQDISNAGGRAGIDGPRSGLWSEYVRVVRVLRPDFIFVENVPELAAYLGRVLGPLDELGFDAEWGVFSAAEVGAPHLRERMFILAWRTRDVADPNGHRQLQPQGGEQEQRGRIGDGREALADADRLRREGGPGDRTPRTHTTVEGRGGWTPEPDVGRVVDGPSPRLDASRRLARLRCLGNAVVPQQAAHAFMTLAQRAALLEGP